MILVAQVLRHLYGLKEVVDTNRRRRAWRLRVIHMMEERARNNRARQVLNEWKEYCESKQWCRAMLERADAILTTLLCRLLLFRWKSRAAGMTAADQRLKALEDTVKQQQLASGFAAFVNARDKGKLGDQLKHVLLRLKRREDSNLLRNGLSTWLLYCRRQRDVTRGLDRIFVAKARLCLLYNWKNWCMHDHTARLYSERAASLASILERWRGGVLRRAFFKWEAGIRAEALRRRLQVLLCRVLDSTAAKWKTARVSAAWGALIENARLADERLLAQKASARKLYVLFCNSLRHEAASAFFKWKLVLSAGKVKEQAQQKALRFLNRLSKGRRYAQVEYAFSRWRDVHQTGNALRDTLWKWQQRLNGHKLQHSFDLWFNFLSGVRQADSERLRQQQAQQEATRRMAFVVARWNKAAIADAFDHWRGLCERTEFLRERLRRVALVSDIARQRAFFRRWGTQSERLQREEQGKELLRQKQGLGVSLLEKCFRRWRHRQLLQAFLAWTDHTETVGRVALEDARSRTLQFLGAKITLFMVNKVANRALGSAFRHWADATHEDVYKETLLKKVLGRLQINVAARGFASWASFVQSENDRLKEAAATKDIQAAKLRLFMRCCNNSYRGAIRSSFLRWKGFVQAVSTANRTKTLIARQHLLLLNNHARQGNARSLKQAFARWQNTVRNMTAKEMELRQQAEIARLTKLRQSGAARVLNSVVKRYTTFHQVQEAFSEWSLKTHRMRAIESTLAHISGTITHRQVKYRFWQWKALVKHSADQASMIKRLLLVYSSAANRGRRVSVLRALHRWKTHTMASKMAQQEESVRHVLLSRLGRYLSDNNRLCLSHYFLQWKSRHLSQRRALEGMNRILGRQQRMLFGSLLGKAFAQFKLNSLHRKSQQRILSVVIARFRHAQLAAGFRSWKSWNVDYSLKLGAMSRLLSLLRTHGVAPYFERWESQTNALRLADQRKAQLRSLFLRIPSLSMTWGALECWKQFAARRARLLSLLHRLDRFSATGQKAAALQSWKLSTHRSQEWNRVATRLLTLLRRHHELNEHQLRQYFFSLWLRRCGELRLESNAADYRRKLLLRCVTRMSKRTLVSAFSQWDYTVKRHLRVRSRLRNIVAAWNLYHLRVGFLALRRNCSSQRETSLLTQLANVRIARGFTMVRGLFARLQRVQVTRAWNSWRDMVEDERRKEVLMKRVLGRLCHRELSNGFETWWKFVDGQRSASLNAKQREALFAKVGRRWRLIHAAAAFNRWVEMAEERRSLRNRIKSMLGRWSSFNLRAGFEAFRRNVVWHRESVLLRQLASAQVARGMDRLQMLFSRWQQMQVTRAWNSWRDMVEDERRKEVLMKRVLGRLCHRELSNGFETWWKFVDGQRSASLNAKQREALFAKVGRRWRLIHAAAAFNRWVEMAEERRSLRNRIKSMLGRWSSFNLRAGFEAFRRNVVWHRESVLLRHLASAQVARGMDRLQMLFSRWQQMQVTRAWNSWRDMVEDERRKEVLMKRVLGRLCHRETRAAWASWVWFVRDHERQNLLAKVGRRWRLIHAAAAFNRWVEMAEERRSLRNRIKSMLGRWSSFNLRAGFEAFRRNVVWHRESVLLRQLASAQVARGMDHLRLLFGRWQQMQVTRAWNSWRDMVEDERRKEVLVKRVLGRLCHRELSNGFETWWKFVDGQRSASLNAKQREALFAKVGRRWRLIHAAAAFNRWVEMAEERRSLRNRIKSMLGRWSSFNLRAGFEAFRRNVVWHRESVLLRHLASAQVARGMDRLQMLFSRWQQMQVTRAWNSWRDMVEDERRKEVLMKRVLGRLCHRETRAAWASWVWFVRDHERQNLLAKVGRRWRLIHAASVFNRWVEMAEERRSLRNRIKSMLGRWSSFNLRAGFEAFRRNVVWHRESVLLRQLASAQVARGMDHLRLLFGRWQQMQVTRAWNSWRDMVEDERRKEVLVKRVLGRLCHRELSNGFETWWKFVDGQRSASLNAKQREALFAKVGRRWRLIHAAAAFNRWVEMAEERRCLRNRIKSMLGRWSSFNLRAGFEAFRRNVVWHRESVLLRQLASAQVARGMDHLRLLFGRWQQMQVTRAWNSWRDMVEDERRKEVLMKRVLGRLCHRELSNGFETWWKFVDGQRSASLNAKQREALFAKVGRRWRLIHAASAFNRWVEMAEERRSLRNRIKSMLGRWSSFNLRAGFEAFRRNVVWHRESVLLRQLASAQVARGMDHLRLLFGRWQQMQVTRAWNSWRDMVEDERRKEVLMKRVLGRLCHRELSNGFETWWKFVDGQRSASLNAKQREALFAKVGRRWRLIHAAAAFNRWVEMAEERRSLRNRIKSMLGRWSSFNLRAGFEAFRRNVVWHRESQLSLRVQNAIVARGMDRLQMLFSRWQQMQLTRAWNSWHDMVEDERRKEVLMKRVLAGLFSRHLSVAWTTWVSHVNRTSAASLRRKAVLRAAIIRFKFRRLSAAWSTWLRGVRSSHITQVEAKYRRMLLQRVLTRFTKSASWKAFWTWKLKAAAEKSRHAAMQKTLRKWYFGRVRFAFMLWKQRSHDASLELLRNRLKSLQHHKVMHRCMQVLRSWKSYRMARAFRLWREKSHKAVRENYAMRMRQLWHLSTISKIRERVDRRYMKQSLSVWWSSTVYDRVMERSRRMKLLYLLSVARKQLIKPIQDAFFKWRLHAASQLSNVTRQALLSRLFTQLEARRHLEEQTKAWYKWRFFVQSDRHFHDLRRLEHDIDHLRSEKTVFLKQRADLIRLKKLLLQERERFFKVQNLFMRYKASMRKKLMREADKRGEDVSPADTSVSPMPSVPDFDIEQELRNMKLSESDAASLESLSVGPEVSMELLDDAQGLSRVSASNSFTSIGSHRSEQMGVEKVIVNTVRQTRHKARMMTQRWEGDAVSNHITYIHCCAQGG